MFGFSSSEWIMVGIIFLIVFAAPRVGRLGERMAAMLTSRKLDRPESRGMAEQPILFVTDPSAEVARMASALQARGYQVVDLPLSLLVARVVAQRPALVFLDVDAEGALEAVQRVRELPGGDGIEILLIGQHGKTMTDTSDAVLAGASGLLLRPLDLSLVLRKVQGLVPLDLLAIEANGASSSQRPARGPASMPPPSMPPPSVPSRRVISEPPIEPASWAMGAAMTPRLSEELQRVLSLAEARVEAGDRATSDPPSPEAEVDAVLPLQLLEALEEPLLHDDDHGSWASATPMPTRGTRSQTGTSSDAGPSEPPPSLDSPAVPRSIAASPSWVTDGGAPSASAPPPSSSLPARQVLEVSTRIERMTGGRGSEPPTGVERLGARGSEPPPFDSFLPPAFPPALAPSLAAIPPAAAVPVVPAVPPAVPTPRPSPRRAPTARPSPSVPLPPPVPAGSLDAAPASSPAPSSLSGALQAPTNAPPRPTIIEQTPAQVAPTVPPLLAATRTAPPVTAPAVKPAPVPAAAVSLPAAAVSLPAAAVSLPPVIPPPAPPAPVVPAPVVLGEADALGLLARAVSERYSGVLCFDAQGGLRRVVLRDGDLVTAGSSLDDESLVSFLEQQGELPRDLARKLAGKLPPFGRHAGAALVAHGHLGQDRLWEALRGHAEWLLGRALGVTEGVCSYEAEPSGRLRSEPSVFGGSTGSEVLVESARRVLSPAEALRRLGGAKARLGEGRKPALLGECALSGRELELIERSRGFTLGEILEAGQSPELASVLLALVALGVLDTLAPAEAESLPPPPHDDLDDEALRARVRARAALVEEGDYFAVLGVPRGATPYEIKRAYIELRRSFEPSRVLAPATADLAETLRTILEVLDEAFEVLRDVNRRERYRRAIEARPPED